MNILFYCQHVLGVGHYFRSLEICAALDKHSVTLVLGGPTDNLPQPENINTVHLPCLMMDREFSALSVCEQGSEIEAIKSERKKLLISLVNTLDPYIFIVELYPFGRKAFSFELEPAIKAARALSSCTVVCSLRDILVEKNKQAAYEERVIKILNVSFDALLVHSDPLFLPLTKTFSSVDKMNIPIVYTGFVARKEQPVDESSVRSQLGLDNKDRLLVASAGSGSVGHNLLEAVINALPHLKIRNIQLIIFAGPYMEESEYRGLHDCASGRDNIRIHRFTNDFLSYLGAADLSISMAGYNTCMNIMVTNTPALMWPFSQNREQRMRAELLGGPITVLEDHDLRPHKLADAIDQKLTILHEKVCRVDLNGAKNSARWLEQIGGR
ncbi:MAG: glycosyl transferase [Deltaproteobacteria bacterium]|nr:glycosyl transferase [Deltaproteobacteria bacterium]